MVIVTTVDMPESCFACPFSVEFDNYMNYLYYCTLCKNRTDVSGYTNKRHENCPLIDANDRQRFVRQTGERKFI